MILALIHAATAAPRVDPRIEEATAEADWATWSASQGKTGDATVLLCRPFAEQVSLCFTSGTGAKLRWLTKADAPDVASLETKAATTIDKLSETHVEGFSRPYWLRAEADGLDHAALLRPDELARKLGGEPLVAVPNRDVLVAWLPGDPDFDKVVAVGVRKMYATLRDPVSPLIYRWDGQRWATWGVANAVDGDSPRPGE